MRLVVLESPYAGPTPEAIERNVRYARACLADCLRRGEAPIASHLLYTQPGVLRDEVPEERAAGIEAGLAWGRHAQASVFYEDLGWSGGMRLGRNRAEDEGRAIEVRTLPADVLVEVLGA
jgi:hypothetical protein